MDFNVLSLSANSQILKCADYIPPIVLKQLDLRHSDEHSDLDSSFNDESIE